MVSYYYGYKVGLEKAIGKDLLIPVTVTIVIPLKLKAAVSDSRSNRL